MSKYKGGTIANIAHQNGKNYENCFYDAFNGEWVSPTMGRVYTDISFVINIVSVPTKPEPKNKYAIIKHEDKVYCRTGKNSAFPWQCAGDSEHSDYSWKYFLGKEDDIIVIWSGLEDDSW